MSEEALNHMLSIYQKLPPTKNFLGDLIDIKPELTDDLLSSVDQPLQVFKSEQPFLMSDYNRDGDLFRSPFDNKFYSLETKKAEKNGDVNEKLLSLEKELNSAFETYTNLYYATGISSVYVYQVEDQINVAILIKNVIENAQWDAIHIIEFKEGSQVEYQLTSTIHVFMGQNTVILGGNLHRSVNNFNIDKRDCPCRIFSIIAHLKYWKTC
eukprot:NODE_91_length_21557_cov_0.766660.p13 type:complete len:211 gc:universal NODE_91_length_21557_cov_0.766660:7655-7023(-)